MLIKRLTNCFIEFLKRCIAMSCLWCFKTSDIYVINLFKSVSPVNFDELVITTPLIFRESSIVEQAERNVSLTSLLVKISNVFCLKVTSATSSVCLHENTSLLISIKFFAIPPPWIYRRLAEILPSQILRYHDRKPRITEPAVYVLNRLCKPVRPLIHRDSLHRFLYR